MSGQRQTCHCGWSKITTYQGLRNHQGKRGCTPKGQSIPQHQQPIVLNTYNPKITYTLPQIEGDFNKLFFLGQVGFHRHMMELNTDAFGQFDVNEPAQAYVHDSAPFRSLQNEPMSLSLLSQVTVEDAPLPKTESKQETKHPTANMDEEAYEISEHTMSSPLPDPAATQVSFSYFGTPHKPLQSSGNGNRTRRALDFPLYSQQFVPESKPAADVAPNEKENTASVLQQLSTTVQANSTAAPTTTATYKEPESSFPFTFSSNASQLPSCVQQPASFSTEPTASNGGAFKFSSDMSTGTQKSVLKPASFNTEPTASNCGAFKFSSDMSTGTQKSETIDAVAFNSQSTASNGGATGPESIFGGAPKMFSGAQQSVSSANGGSTQLKEKGSLIKPHQPTVNPVTPMNDLLTADGALQNVSSSTANQETNTMFKQQQPPVQSQYNIEHQAPSTQQFTVPVSQNLSTHPTSTSSDVAVRVFGSPPQALQSTSQRTQVQQSKSQTCTTQPGPSTSNATVENKPVSQPPPPTTKSTGVQQPVQTPASQSSPLPKAGAKAITADYEPPKHLGVSKTIRVSNFSTGAQQAQALNIPTTLSQEGIMQVKHIDSEVEMKREAARQLQLQKDKIIAEIQHRIRSREQKLDEVQSRVKGCEVSLDEEWLEINTVFSDVIQVVEEARKRALQPLENRREKLERDAQSVIKKLQEDIAKLETVKEEVDESAEIDVASLKKVRLRDFSKLNVNTSFSFGMLQATVSTMMERIQEELEKMSTLELKRAPSFAVDVKLDQTTAHQCLTVSKDRKKVQDGGQSQQVPMSPGRFDMFGSILGVNKFTSGKAYWEVEVGTKSGWDLGVASAKANRKGKLTLKPDNGYWVIVHYEGDKYAALAAPPVCLELEEQPQKVGVFLDYDEGLVSFYNVTTVSHIHSFTKCGFGDEIIPYFSPHLKQNGKNSEPLIISPVKN